MGVLNGLAGVRKAELPCVYARSVTDALVRIKTRRAVTAAGSDGAINIWRDDKGCLRSNFCRFRQTVTEAEHTSAASLRRWLKVWWPQMDRFRAATKARDAKRADAVYRAQRKKTQRQSSTSTVQRGGRA